MKKIVIFLVAVLIVAGGAIAGYYFLIVRPSSNSILGSFPSYFPKEIVSDPYIINLEVLADASKLTSEQHRVSVSYTSQRSFADNEKSFKDYFEKNNYKVNVVDSKDSHFIIGQKDKTNVSITLWKKPLGRIGILYIVNK